MASAMLIFLYLRYETTYDRFHPDFENTWRIGTDLQVMGARQTYAVTSAGMAPALVAEFDDFTDFVRVFHVYYFLRDVVYQYEERQLFEKEVYAVDSTFFNLFGAKFLEGNAQGALSQPFDMVLTEPMAHELFGAGPALGKRVFVPGAGYFTVRAVIEEPPLNTHLRYRGLISISTLHHLDELFNRSFGPGVQWSTLEETFGSTLVWSYLRTRPGFSPASFMEVHWPGFHEKHIRSIARQHGLDIQLLFQPLASIHMDSGWLYDRSTQWVQMQALDPSLVKVFFAIALFLLVVAAINYANIAISNFNKRRMEMAMVKILGSDSRQVFAGFFTEAIITAGVGLILGLVLLELILPSVNLFLGTELALNFREDVVISAMVLLVLLSTSMLAGLSPALYFARARVAGLMLYRKNHGRKSLILKKLLVCFQFAISAFMIASSLLVYRQMEFMQQMDVGYNTRHIAAIELQGRFARENVHILDSLLWENAGVEQTAATGYVFTMMPITHSVLMETSEGMRVKSINTVHVTGDYLELMGIEIYNENGRVDASLLNDPGKIFINQALADTMGFERVTGRTITTHFQFLDGRLRSEREVAGIIDNVHYALLNQPAEPLILIPMMGLPNYLVVRFAEGQSAHMKEILERAWMQYDPGSQVAGFFLSDIVEDFFLRQQRLSRFFGYFAWMCVLISFLGVFGITAYNLEQRSSEIAVRRVLGAGWWDVFTTFFADYRQLLLIAFATGGLVAYLSLQQWLAGFAYSAGLSAWPFLGAALLVGATVILAVGIHAWRASRIQPGSALRTNA